MILFLDANVVIYLVEGAQPFADAARAAIQETLDAHPRAGVALSRLSWLECRIRPMRLNQHDVLAAYDAFFARPDLHWLELTREVVELAAVIRARHGLATPDALQAAGCLQLGDEHLLLTGDAVFQRVPGLHITLL